MLLDEIELNTRHTDESLEDVLKNIQFYSSALCSNKVKESISPDLVQIDSKIIQLKVKNIDYNLFQKSNTVNVSLDQDESENYVTLTKELADLVKSLKSNKNTESQKNGFCLALGKVSKSIAIRLDSNIISPLVWFNTINPWIRHAYSQLKLRHYFVVPVPINEVARNGKFKVILKFS